MAEYRIDDLARVSGTTVRNVRAYQDRKLLPRPKIVGRVAYYDESHIARLRFIAQMLERSFSLAQIEGFLNALNEGRDLAEVLGLETQVMTPWTDEVPAAVTRAELEAAWGPLSQADLEAAHQVGLLQTIDGELIAPSPRLLQVGAELHQAGMPLTTLFELSQGVSAGVEALAKLILDAIVPQLFPEWAEGQRLAEDHLADRAALIQRLRPLAKTAVDAYLARAMETQVSQWLAAAMPAQH